MIRASADGQEYEFCETPEDGSILQYNASLGLYVPVAGPGPIAPLSTEPLENGDGQNREAHGGRL